MCYDIAWLKFDWNRVVKPQKTSLATETAWFFYLCTVPGPKLRSSFFWSMILNNLRRGTGVELSSSVSISLYFAELYCRYMLTPEKFVHTGSRTPDNLLRMPMREPSLYAAAGSVMMPGIWRIRYRVAIESELFSNTWFADYMPWFGKRFKKLYALF